ncbi:Monooxygenase [Diaporthe eres]|nr:Monooxygenase [Diaporthe eres]
MTAKKYPHVLIGCGGKINRPNRQRLRGWLLPGIDLQFGKRAVRIGERGETVVVRFEGGTSEFGDILLGAEGTRKYGDEFAHQLSLVNSAYIIMNSTPEGRDQSGVFAALNRERMILVHEKTRMYPDHRGIVDNTPRALGFSFKICSWSLISCLPETPS